MGQMSVQYTPVQVLQAARRAEAEGKMDYALQFYRHLVEHHGTTAEAQEAREGLFRIAEWRWGEARTTNRQDVVNGPPGRASASPPPSQSSFGASAHDYSAPEPANHLPQVFAREAAKAAGAAIAPPYKSRYRNAMIVASVVSAVGWAVVFSGLLLAALAAGGYVADVSAGGLLGLPIGVLLGVPSAVIGLVLIVIGQMAVAVFESTNATLEQLALDHERASA